MSKTPGLNYWLYRRLEGAWHLCIAVFCTVHAKDPIAAVARRKGFEGVGAVCIAAWNGGQ